MEWWPVPVESPSRPHTLVRTKCLIRAMRARPSFVNTQVFSQLDTRLHLEMELGKRPAGTRRLEDGTPPSVGVPGSGRWRASGRRSDQSEYPGAREARQVVV